MRKDPNRVLDDSDIERTEEYEKFIADLQVYHEKRGYGKTHFSCFDRSNGQFKSARGRRGLSGTGRRSIEEREDKSY